MASFPFCNVNSARLLERKPGRAEAASAIERTTIAEYFMSDREFAVYASKESCGLWSDRFADTRSQDEG